MKNLQVLLDLECRISDLAYNNQTDLELVDCLKQARTTVLKIIEEKRGTEVPVCYGEDDCSSLILSMCPWRMTCGT